MIMNDFATRFSKVKEEIISLSNLVDSDTSLLGSLSVEDVFLLQGFVKEISWYQGK